MDFNDDIEIKYELSEDQFKKMYEECRYITFYNCKEQKQPVSIFVGGQTGAGKGGIDIFSEKELLNEEKHAAILDVDIYRLLHPYAKEILAQYPTKYTSITKKATSKILKMLMNEAISNNYNFIFEGTLRNTEAFETMKMMPQNYKKIVRVMATSDKESLLTAFERNYQQILLSGYGRFTDVETHNITYNGVLETIKTIEKSNEDITIQIFTRGKDMTSPILIYNSDESDAVASDILEIERTNDRKKYINERKERLDNLLKILIPHNEFEKNQLDKLKEQIIKKDNN